MVALLFVLRFLLFVVLASSTSGDRHLVKKLSTLVFDEFLFNKK
jgi:hypothetical protein